MQLSNETSNSGRQVETTGNDFRNDGRFDPGCRKAWPVKLKNDMR